MAKIHEIDGWIDRVKEEIIDPQREIIDPHHHLWHGHAKDDDEDQLFPFVDRLFLLLLCLSTHLFHESLPC